MAQTFRSSITYDPGSILDGNFDKKAITMTGVALGDIVQASFDVDLVDLQLTAQVVAANEVEAVISNSTNGTVDLASGTLRIVVTSLSGLHVG